MRLGRIEILLVVLVVCAAAYMGLQYLPSKAPPVCSPVPLSPEVKAYIDKALAQGGGNAQCGDIPAVLSRVTEMETKMGSITRYEELANQMREKREEMNQTIQSTRQSQTDVLATLRNAELSRLRNELAMMCAGISIRSSDPGGSLNSPQGPGQRRGPGPRGQQGAPGGQRRGNGFGGQGLNNQGGGAPQGGAPAAQGDGAGENQN